LVFFYPFRPQHAEIALNLFRLIPVASNEPLVSLGDCRLTETRAYIKVVCLTSRFEKNGGFFVTHAAGENLQEQLEYYLAVSFAFGLRQTLRPGRASLAAPILMGLFGSALIVAGVFSTDPALGYPVGALPIHTTHGMVHGLAGLAAFSLLPVTALVMAWRGSPP